MARSFYLASRIASGLVKNALKRDRDDILRVSELEQAQSILAPFTGSDEGYAQFSEIAQYLVESIEYQARLRSVRRVPSLKEAL